MYQENLLHLFFFVSDSIGWWFSQGPPVSSTNTTDRHNITSILVKVALNTIKQTNKQSICFLFSDVYWRWTTIVHGMFYSLLNIVLLRLIDLFSIILWRSYEGGINEHGFWRLLGYNTEILIVDYSEWRV